MKQKINWMTVLTAVLFSAVISWIIMPKSNQTASNETVYNRVIRTKKLRCGYGTWPPLLMKDLKTGQLKGVVKDVMTEMETMLGIKIEFTEEVGWSTFIESLKSERVDAMCGIFPESQRGVHIDFTIPMYYTIETVFVRKGDNRFRKDPSKLNSPKIMFSGIDGDLTPIHKHFPKAKILSLPQLSNSAEMFLNLTTGKADAVISDDYTVSSFMKENPNTFQKANNDLVVDAFGLTVGLKKGENKLRLMLNTALQELHNNGTIERILKKYDTYPGLTRVNKQYESR